MPIYEYQCQKCERHFEYMQKMSDTPVDQCSDCGGKLTRLISLSSFHLKGTGWYKTDYGSGTSPKNGKSDKKSESEKSGTKSELKEPPKPETKTESTPKS